MKPLELGISLKSGRPPKKATLVYIGNEAGVNRRRRQPSRGGTSRISRQAYVRFCEGLEVKFPGPTRRFLSSRADTPHGRFWHKASIFEERSDFRCWGESRPQLQIAPRARLTHPRDGLSKTFTCVDWCDNDRQALSAQGIVRARTNHVFQARETSAT